MGVPLPADGHTRGPPRTWSLMALSALVWLSNLHQCGMTRADQQFVVDLGSHILSLALRTEGIPKGFLGN